MINNGLSGWEAVTYTMLAVFAIIMAAGAISIMSRAYKPEEKKADTYVPIKTYTESSPPPSSKQNISPGEAVRMMRDKDCRLTMEIISCFPGFYKVPGNRYGFFLLTDEALRERFSKERIMEYDPDIGYQRMVFKEKDPNIEGYHFDEEWVWPGDNNVVYSECKSVVTDFGYCIVEWNNGGVDVISDPGLSILTIGCGFIHLKTALHSDGVSINQDYLEKKMRPAYMLDIDEYFIVDDWRLSGKQKGYLAIKNKLFDVVSGLIRDRFKEHINARDRHLEEIQRVNAIFSRVSEKQSRFRLAKKSANIKRRKWR